MISIAMIIIWWWWHAFAGPGGVDDSKLKLQDLKILFFWLRQNYLMTDFGHVLKHLVKFMSTIWENCWEYRLPAWEMYGTGRIGKILFLCNLIFMSRFFWDLRGMQTRPMPQCAVVPSLRILRKPDSPQSSPQEFFTLESLLNLHAYSAVL